MSAQLGFNTLCALTVQLSVQMGKDEFIFHEWTYASALLKQKNGTTNMIFIYLCN